VTTDDPYAERKKLTFAQAEGLEPLPTQLALRQISQQFRAALWWDLKGIFEQHRERSSYGHEYLERPWAIILQDAHVYHHLASGTCRAETELVGWACEIRTQKCRRKLSL